MSKSMGCLGVLVALMLVGYCEMRKEVEDRAAVEAAMTPEERAGAAAAAKTRENFARQAREATPAYQKGLAEFAIKQRAKDPGSVQVRNMQVYRRGADTMVVCGEVNMKNGFGGYIGFQAFASVRGAVVMEGDAKEVGERLVNQFFAMCANR